MVSRWVFHKRSGHETTKKDGIPGFPAAHTRDVVGGTKDVAIERLGADLARGHKDENCFLLF